MPPRAPSAVQFSAAAAQENSRIWSRVWPCEQGKRESGVEDVAGAGGVDCFDPEGRAVVERAAVPGEGAVAAESGSGDAAAEAPMEFK